MRIARIGIVKPRWIRAQKSSSGTAVVAREEVVVAGFGVAFFAGVVVFGGVVGGVGGVAVAEGQAYIDASSTPVAS